MTMPTTPNPDRDEPDHDVDDVDVLDVLEAFNAEEIVERDDLGEEPPSPTSDADAPAPG